MQNAVDFQDEPDTGLESPKAKSKPPESEPCLPTPKWDLVLLKPVALKTTSGIILPEKQASRFHVVAVGPGGFENGHRVPMRSKVGEKVMVDMPPSGLPTIRWGSETYAVAEDRIVAFSLPEEEPDHRLSEALPVDIVSAKQLPKGLIQ